MTTTFFFGQHVDLSLELGVRLDGAWLAKNLATLDVILFNTTEQSADVVTSTTLVEDLLEHFDTSDSGLLVVAETDDFNFVADFDDALLDTAGHHSTATLDGEDIFHRHEEVFVGLAWRLGDVLVTSSHQFVDALVVVVVGWVVQSRTGRTPNHGQIVAGEVVAREQLANFHLDELQELFVVDHVALVEEHHESGNLHLLREQDVLTGLGHRTVGRSHHQNAAVHLGRTGDHVLHVVGVTRAVDVSVVTVFGHVLLVRSRDGDTTSFLFRRVVDLIERASV